MSCMDVVEIDDTSSKYCRLLLGLCAIAFSLTQAYDIVLLPQVLNLERAEGRRRSFMFNLLMRAVSRTDNNRRLKINMILLNIYAL